MTLADASCPICGHRGFDLVGEYVRPKHAHKMYRCRTCKVVADERLWNVDAAQNLATQAIATEDWYTRPYTAEEFERRILVARDILGEFGKFMRDSAAFVELGVGEGFLARAAAGRFAEVYGLDIDLTAADNVSKQFGCPGNLRFLPHEQFASLGVGTVSVVAMWHVLEHLYDPLAVLRPFVDRMPDGGLVIGQVPLFREDYIFDEHFLFHNESSLFHLAAALGCTPILTQRDEGNDFLSFCFRKASAAFDLTGLPPGANERPGAAAGALLPPPARAAGRQGALPGTARDRPSLRSLGVPSLFVFGHQRSGTNVLVDAIAGSLACDVLNEGDPAAFSNFRLKPFAEVSGLVESSLDGCLLKPITESIKFREILHDFPDSRAVFVVRNPLEVVPSFLTEFRHHLTGVAYEIVHNYKWTRFRDVGVSLESWAEVDHLLDKYGGRFDAQRQLPSVVALSWLLLHAALKARGILQEPACAVLDYTDIFDGDGMGRAMQGLFNGDVRLAPARRRRRDAQVFASEIDIELAKDCLELYGTFRSRAVRPAPAIEAPAPH